MGKKTLLPNDFRDFLSIISILGFIAIFLEFGLDIRLLSESMTEVYLIIGGLGIMTLSKVFSIGIWVKDGIQKNETLQLLGGVIGTTMLIIGSLFMLNIEIGERMLGYVGIISLFPAVFIFADYLAKNK